MPIFDFLAQAVAAQGLTLDQLSEDGLIADNSNFDVFNVPNVYLGYMNANDFRMKSSPYFHYANHWHDPYETVEVAREVSEAFVGMTRLMLSFALETGRAQPNLRVTPTGDQRALFVSSHTEATNVPTSMLRELGMALAWEGFDVDMIPYAQAITPADLKNVGYRCASAHGGLPGSAPKKPGAKLKSLY